MRFPRERMYTLETRMSCPQEEKPLSFAKGG
jgi:hypothetical protein